MTAHTGGPGSGEAQQKGANNRVATYLDTVNWLIEHHYPEGPFTFVQVGGCDAAFRAALQERWSAVIYIAADNPDTFMEEGIDIVFLHGGDGQVADLLAAWWPKAGGFLVGSGLGAATEALRAFDAERGLLHSSDLDADCWYYYCGTPSATAYRGELDA